MAIGPILEPTSPSPTPTISLTPTPTIPGSPGQFNYMTIKLNGQFPQESAIEGIAFDKCESFHPQGETAQLTLDVSFYSLSAFQPTNAQLTIDQVNVASSADSTMFVFVKGPWDFTLPLRRS